MATPGVQAVGIESSSSVRNGHSDRLSVRPRLVLPHLRQSNLLFSPLSFFFFHSVPQEGCGRADCFINCNSVRVPSRCFSCSLWFVSAFGKMAVVTYTAKLSGLLLQGRQAGRKDVKDERGKWQEPARRLGERLWCWANESMGNWSVNLV